MRFVYRQAIDAHAFKERLRSSQEQCFGRKIEHLHFTRAYCRNIFFVLHEIERTVEADGADTELCELRDLVLHERNQRRYDNSQTFEEQRGYLVTEGFTTACRHDDECVLFCQNAIDDTFLVEAKLLITEDCLQDIPGSFESWRTTGHWAN